MHTRYTTLSLLALLLTAGVSLAACEKDEFADAPKAQAPATPGAIDAPAAPVSPVAPVADLPPGHPPLGQVQGAPAGAPGVPGGTMAGAPGSVRFASPEEFGTTGPLRWKAPEGWQAAQPATSMRLAEYVVPGPQGTEPATMSIFYFGAGGGGGVDANIDRWVGQFSGGEPAKRETIQAGGMNVHLVDATGTFNPGMAGSGPPKENQRMLGAIAEAPAGAFFFKLVGPAESVAAQEEAFASFVQSFAPGS